MNKTLSNKIAAEAAAKSAKELAKMLEGWERIDLIDYRLLLPFFQSALSQSLAARDKEIEEHREALQAVLDYYEDKEPKDEHSNCREHVCAIAAARALLKGKAI